MQTFKIKISENGRILIPANLREKLSLKFGEEIIIKVVEGGLLITSLIENVKQAQAKVRALTQGRSLVDTLQALRGTADEL